MELAEDDWTLLRRYADDRDEAAFARLTRRHVNFVYSSAIRRVGDGHLAEEVTQAVFIMLARKAKSLRGGDGAMSAWLVKCVRYAAANAAKVDARRRKHERAFAEHHAYGRSACSANPSDVIVWQEIAGELDDAVLSLSSGDRQAILLRYFEGRQVHEIALRLQLTETAVRKRLSRAIDRLRRRLSRRGAALLSTADIEMLAGMLASYAVVPAPAGLAQASAAAATGVVGTAAAGIAVTSEGTSIAKGAMTMMAWTNAKVAAGIIGAIVFVCGAGGIIAIRNADAADGKRPAVTLAADAAPEPSQPVAAAAAEESAQKQDAVADADDADAAVSLKKAPPVVVKTVPQSGSSSVDPGIEEISVTYSKTMTNGSWSWSTWGEDTFPKTTGKPRYKEDKRTCVLPVELKPGKTYAIWLNSENFGNFKDADGRRAVPYLLIFKTRK
jgi:RNA polymerase sigma factor (sigma-70 family)